MTRPSGKVETFIKDFHPLGYLVVFGLLAWASVSLAPGNHKKALAWFIIFAAALLVVRLLVCWYSHRLEHPWWYRREHVREGTMRFNGRRNRFEIGARKLYSYDQLYRRRGPSLIDPDRGY
jgi:hypothetical protein